MDKFLTEMATYTSNPFIIFCFIFFIFSWWFSDYLKNKNKRIQEKTELPYANFENTLKNYKTEQELLNALKEHLKQLLQLRWDYERANPTSKEELYNEDSVMDSCMKDLKMYSQETDLINYCALILDAFDKDRSYKYGFTKEKKYKLRYIYGSVQWIIEEEIKKIENNISGFSSKLHEQKLKLEAANRQQYEKERGQ